MHEKDSVAVYFAQAALYGLRGQPERIAAVLAAAGISEQQLSDKSARIAASAFARLWLAVARELDDEFLGFDSHGMPTGSFALICRGPIARRGSRCHRSCPVSASSSACGSSLHQA